MCHRRRIGDQDLFSESGDEAAKPGVHVVAGDLPPGQLLLDGFIPHDRPGDELGERAEVHHHDSGIFLRRHIPAVHVRDIGEDLEGVEADADREHDLGNGQVQTRDQVEVLYEESRVLEDAEHPEEQYKRYNERGPRASRLLFIPEHADRQPAAPADQGRREDQRETDDPAPRIENQGEDQKQGVFETALRKKVIQREEQREKRADENHR